jgi:hypothetical protein
VVGRADARLGTTSSRSYDSEGVAARSRVAAGDIVEVVRQRVCRGALPRGLRATTSRSYDSEVVVLIVGALAAAHVAYP